MRLTRTLEFATSLRYVLPDLSDQENRQRFGEKCQQHGHNYHLEVTVRGEVDPVTGMVIDLKRLQDILDREVMDRFDHRDLNCDTAYFEKLVPTPENFVRVIRELLVEALPEGIELDRIRLQPDSETWVDWVEAESRV
ncbi:MAG: 6-carboxytetrahydropterin synthase [Deltaproteobacteria bacterium]|nr:6-carboxytetrahydropterin synthase [Myxococcales bacterium]MCH8132588.1 6-carboxytetrahydropterin synthase [Myxococcales bacterium]TDJ11335.1 MAG: 6-carboxytetrahydropterin synthase [Deltaproteobacteria bacterium]TDJ20428.1 MAG: 6-carboxytetrahydropterin synthase [Deltaproteobacteria bacterium]